MAQAIAAKLSVSQSFFGQAPFGKMPEGTAAELFTLTNAQGMVVKITNFGGIITEIHVPDKHGVFANVNIGFDNFESYL